MAKRLINLERQALPVTISLGLVSYPEDGQNVEELVQRVDKALYQAKHLGKDRICLWGE